jgi:hypothetical protein
MASVVLSLWPDASGISTASNALMERGIRFFHIAIENFL